MSLIKKISLVVVVLSLLQVYAQDQLITDYSFKDSYGYDSSFLSTNLHIEKNGKVERNEVIIKKGSKNLPKISIPFDDIDDFKTFLTDGLEKFIKWDSLRMENEIGEMKKQIAVFNKKVEFVGDDYGVFIERTDVELNFISWKSGRSVMQIRAYANDGVRSDIFAAYLHYGNRDLKRSANNEAFQLFLVDFNIGNFEKEKDKINSKASLFD